MRRGLTFALIVVVALGLPVSASAREVGSTAARDEVSSWIVSLAPGVDPRTAAPGLAKQAGGKAGRIFEHALRGFVFHGSARQAKALEKRPGVRHVVADGKVRITAETTPPGIARIRARHATAPDAHDQGFTGVGARVAVLDTGIDLTHPDLVAAIDGALGRNCYNTGPPQDGHGHGTHVAGTIAGQAGNNIGVVGVAPSARLVPVKVLSNSGEGEWSNVICGIDYVMGLATDADPANDVDVINMSLGDTGPTGNCSDGGLREAVCRSVAAGVVIVAASGNSFTDASTFIPAAFPEVITVSAITDFDGEPGGSAGCRFIFLLLGTYCDDQYAAFANSGSVIEVTAPGVEVFSSWTGGGYQSSSGTSMAAPHVTGVAALVRAANQALTPAEIEALIERTGDSPDGTSAESGCGTQGQWIGDPDGVAEPLVNALRAAQRAADPSSSPYPTVSLTPADGGSVSGVVTLAATATHPSGIASVEFLVDNVSVGTDTSAPYSATWNASTTWDGERALTARATPSSGLASCKTNGVTVGALDQGSWYGKYGVDGFALGGFDGPGTTDRVQLPNATLTLEQGARYSWASPTADARALEDPETVAPRERRATSWYDEVQLRLRLDFNAAYSGTLHVYTYDWDSTTRRQAITVTVGSTTKSIPMTSSYRAGAWLHFPIVVPAGGTVRITGDWVSGWPTTIAGIFLGGAGTPPGPPPPPPPPPPLGNWYGQYGVDGYALGGWNGPGTGDLVALPGATLTLERGARYNWASPTSDGRALESPDRSERRATTWYDQSQLRLRLDFNAAYSGTLHVYTADWDFDGSAPDHRRQRRDDHLDLPADNLLQRRHLAPCPDQCAGRRLGPDLGRLRRRVERHDRRSLPGRGGRPAAGSTATVAVRRLGGYVRGRWIRARGMERAWHQ